MTDITLQNIESHPIGEITALPPATLMGLLADAEEAARKARLVREWIEGAVNLKYGQRFEALRRDQEKPYGVIHLEDNGYNQVRPASFYCEEKRRLIVL